MIFSPPSNASVGTMLQQEPDKKLLQTFGSRTLAHQCPAAFPLILARLDGPGESPTLSQVEPSRPCPRIGGGSPGRFCISVPLNALIHRIEGNLLATLPA